MRLAPSPTAAISTAAISTAAIYTAAIIALTCTACGGSNGAGDPVADAAEPDAAGPDAEVSDTGVPDAVSAPPTGLPAVHGPPPELYDCRAAGDRPDRRSPHPIHCAIDSTCDARLVVGHRGTGGNLGNTAPENSLAAIRAAIAMGFDGIELDVRTTADEQLVLVHDATIDRTAIGEGEVEAMTAAALTTTPLLPPLQPPADADFGCERIPTLAEALALCRDRVFVHLDLKTDRVDLVVAALEAADAVDRVVLSVSDHGRAVEARALAPDVSVQIRPDSLDEYEAALLDFDRPPEIIEIPIDEVEAMAPVIRANGQRVFTDVWAADAVALLAGDGARYLQTYDQGATLLQSEFPALVLMALDRWPAEWPTPLRRSADSSPDRP